MSNAVNETISWKITPPKKKNTWLLDFFHQCHFQHHSSEEVRPNGRPCWLRSNPDVGWKRRGCGPVVQLRSRKAPIDAEWRWPTRGLSCDFQLHQITKKEWRRDKESCWWKCVWAKKKMPSEELVLKWYPFWISGCQHDGDQKPLYLFFGEMGYWTIAASVLAAGVHESLADFFFRKKRIWKSRPKHKVNGLVGNHAIYKSFFK